MVCVTWQGNFVCILMLNVEFQYETSYFNVFIRTFSFSFYFMFLSQCFSVCVCVINSTYFHCLIIWCDVLHTHKHKHTRTLGRSRKILVPKIIR